MKLQEKNYCNRTAIAIEQFRLEKLNNIFCGKDQLRESNFSYVLVNLKKNRVNG